MLCLINKRTLSP